MGSPNLIRQIRLQPINYPAKRKDVAGATIAVIREAHNHGAMPAWSGQSLDDLQLAVVPALHPCPPRHGVTFCWS